MLLTEPPADSDTPADQIPTKANVLEHLSGCAIAHFACHGYSDPADPSQSRLLLHDHRHDPLTVAALAPLTLDHVQLAYLSACGTARMTDGSVLDEAIHLASAFQLAGFPHVIGTLWEINDNAAVEIARYFYSSLSSPRWHPRPRPCCRRPPSRHPQPTRPPAHHPLPLGRPHPCRPLNPAHGRGGTALTAGPASRRTHGLQQHLQGLVLADAEQVTED